MPEPATRRARNFGAPLLGLLPFRLLPLRLLLFAVMGGLMGGCALPPPPAAPFCPSAEEIDAFFLPLIEAAKEREAAEQGGDGADTDIQMPPY